MIVVDSSVAIKWLFMEEYSAPAGALLRSAVEDAEPLLAPALFPVEVTNVIWQRIRVGEITADRGRQLLGAFLTYPIELRTGPQLHEDALALCVTYALPAAYDAHYIALAREAGATLWTADQRLLRALGDRLPFVRSIADYSAK